ncbi:MAG TPA: winged helix-turn-helix domain-containing protein [Methanobacteriaceae archaeon]|jgi:predicted transcriptional regulator|nr:winged helix-turn-helix domain-containing protein [Methanobacteriaceae archaeon]
MKYNAYELLDEVQDNLKFLAISGVRAKILITLQEGPKNLSELRELINLRSSTILHGMNELEKRNIVRKTGDRYNLSATGQILTLNFVDLVKSIIVAKRYEDLWEGHQIDGIPVHLMLQIGSLINADLITSEPTDIYKPHLNFTQIASDSKKFWGISPFFHSEYTELMIEMVSRGVDTKIIVTESIMNKLHELAAQDPEAFANLTSQENFELWITDKEVKLGFTVTDRFISLGLALDDGTYDYSMDLVSDDHDAIIWGEKLFEYYRERSKRVI